MTTTSIYIPTRGRIGKSRQVTLREFTQYSSYVPILVCPPDELKHHSKYHHRVMKCPKSGIGPTRQWLLENCDSDVMIMADDDMRFSYRPVPTRIKLERLFDLNPMIRWIEDLVLKHNFIHGGLGPRQGNNCKELSKSRRVEIYCGHLVQRCVRVNNFHFINPIAVRDCEGRLDALPVMEDLHFTLDLLLKGHPNIVIHDYVWNQEGSGAAGGCSLYRTPKVQTEGAKGLKLAFPEFVSVVTKKSISSSNSWKDFKERDDVRVQWSKAAKAGGIDL